MPRQIEGMPIPFTHLKGPLAGVEESRPLECNVEDDVSIQKYAHSLFSVLVQEILKSWVIADFRSGECPCPLLNELTH